MSRFKFTSNVSRFENTKNVFVHVHVFKEHKTSTAPVEVTHFERERDHHFPDLTYGKIVLYNPYSGLKRTTSF